MLLIHIVAGGIGILSGFAAMFLAKGSARHRLAGTTFAVSMLTLCASGLVIAVFLRPNNLNVVASMLTAYLVASSWLTIRGNPTRPAALDYAATGLGALTALLGLVFGLLATNGGVTAGCFIFGAIAASCVFADLRHAKRAAMTPTRKLRRHLWRMGFPLVIATLSLFLGQADELPAWVTGSRLNVALTLFSVGLLVFWLRRVRTSPGSGKTRAVAALGPAP